MSEIKPPLPLKGRAARQARVLDAAERLLHASGTADFSMRDLADAAEVSFATPFNYFGSKGGIMLALSARRIEAMAERFATRPQAAEAPGRVLAAFAIGAEVLLEAPIVSRHVVGALGSPTGEPGRVADHSRSLWAAALGDLSGISAAMRPLAARHLADHLALGFRGCLSFWVAGEIADAALPARAQAIAAALLLAYVEPAQADRLRAVIEAA